MKKEIRLEKIIPVCAAIEIKRKDQDMWSKSIVMNVHGRFIEVKQIEQFLNPAIMTGDILKCLVIIENSIYLMKAAVYNIKFISGTIVLKVNDYKTINNERRHKRYNVLLCATISENEKLKEHYGVVLNISLSGLCIITNCRLKQRDTVEVCVCSPNSNFINAQCTVRWICNRWSKKVYGLAIENIDDKSKFILSALINKLEAMERDKIEQLMDSKPEEPF
ncbi:MAG TPA: PilZ domain-containing protein [Clostridia bacterium]